MKHYFIRLYKKLFNKPIYRIDILNNIDIPNTFGLCYGLTKSLREYEICPDFEIIFPLFNRVNAKPFGADNTSAYWWPARNWRYGRKDFLNWLKEMYKNDRENLRVKYQKDEKEAIKIFYDKLKRDEDRLLNI